MTRARIYRWLIALLAITLMGCANSRTIVLPPEEISKQNDQEWNILKEPVHNPPIGQP